MSQGFNYCLKMSIIFTYQVTTQCQALAEIPRILYSEEKELYQHSTTTDIIGALHNKAGNTFL